MIVLITSVLETDEMFGGKHSVFGTLGFEGSENDSSDVSDNCNDDVNAAGLFLEEGTTDFVIVVEGIYDDTGKSASLTTNNGLSTSLSANLDDDELDSDTVSFSLLALVVVICSGKTELSSDSVVVDEIGTQRSE